MQPRRRFAIVAVTALAAAGGGAAIAATDEDKGKKTEDAIIDDAAERLDVDPSELRSALSDAEVAQIDQAVEDGVISEEDAEHIKEHMQDSGRVLGFPGGPPPAGPMASTARAGPAARRSSMRSPRSSASPSSGCTTSSCAASGWPRSRARTERA